jgi:glycine cleavage system H protein
LQLDTDGASLKDGRISQVYDRGARCYTRALLFYQNNPNLFLRRYPMSDRAESNVPTNLKYTENDEWLRIEGDTATMGITDYAQDQLSDIVFVEYLLDEGDEASKGDTCATVESVKAAADVYLPVSGEISAVNEELSDNPELINSDPFGDAWMYKIKLSDPSEANDLLDSGSYQVFSEA